VVAESALYVERNEVDRLLTELEGLSDEDS
jgi:hypothetical protein